VHTPIEHAPPLAKASQLTEVVTRLRRALRTSIRSDYSWEARPMAQIEVLMCITDNAPVRVGQIASLQQLAPNTVSGLVQQLVEAGLVDRKTDAKDRRVALITPTDAGVAELQGWKRAHEHRISAAFAALNLDSQHDIAAAIPALDLLVDHLLNYDARSKNVGDE
jgi:DNA-binding MarR family transcriptional regulator